MDVLRDFEPGDLVAAIILDILLGNLRVRHGDDKSTGLLAIFFAGDTHNLHVLHPRHVADEILDLFGRDVFATTDDDILQASSDEVVALLVHVADVARVRPAVGVDTFGGHLRLFVVAGHHVEAAAADLARLVDGAEFAGLGIDDRDLDAGQRLTDGRTLALETRLEITGLRHHRAGLGQPVRNRDFAHVHLIHTLLHALDRTGRAGHQAGTQGGKIKLIEERAVEYGNVHGRLPVHSGTALFFDRHHDVDGIVFFHQHHGRAMVDASHHPQHAAETVEERHRNTHAIHRRKILARTDPEAVIRNVVVRELHPLGKTGGAGSILHVHDIMAAYFTLAGLIFGLRRLHGQRENFIDRVHAAVLFWTQEKDALQTRVVLGHKLAARLLPQFRNQVIKRLYVVRVAKPVDQKEVFGVRLLEREVNLRRLVVRIERQQNGADLGGRKHQRDPMRDVGGPQRDLLAALDAQRHQAAGQPVDLFAELVPRQAEVAVGIDQGILRTAARNRLIEQLPQRVVPRDRQVIPRHSS